MKLTQCPRWCPVPGYEGSYEVSDFGDIRSLDRHVTCSNGRSRFAKGRVLRPGVRPDGHLCVALGRRNTKLVHQLVLLAFVGECPDGQEVRHLNGNPADNRLVNLRYGTQSENSRDRVLHGTHNMAKKTHCPQGHAYDEQNTYTWGGRRNCKTCRRNYKRGWEARRASA